jgi:hypothetical protein
MAGNAGLAGVESAFKRSNSQARPLPPRGARCFNDASQKGWHSLAESGLRRLRLYHSDNHIVDRKRPADLPVRDTHGERREDSVNQWGNMKPNDFTECSLGGMHMAALPVVERDRNEDDAADWIAVEDDFGFGLSVPANDERAVERLLYQHEQEVPPKVRNLVGWFRTHGISGWLSRNRIANGCEDAARKRLRNGRRGIPLADELKSFAATIPGSDRRDEVFILCHAQADCRYDFRKVRAVLKAPGRVTRLSPEGCEQRRIGFGRCNPFVAEATHVFDRSLFTKAGTMMTNACNRTWAIEFDPVAVIRAIDGAIVGDIVEGGETDVSLSSF